MSSQWRHPCRECGKEEIDYLRMHTQINGYGVHIECNLCGSKKTIEPPERANGTDATAVVDLETELGDADD